jgi:hypothetical protein
MQPTHTRHRVASLSVGLLLATSAAVVGGGPAAGRPVRQDADAPPPAACTIGNTGVTGVMAARHWRPVTPSKWRFPGTEVILAEAGTAQPGPRRPFEYAVLGTGPQFGSLQIDAEVRLDTPVPISNRDVIIVFGYRSPTQFFYVHLSSDNTIYPHNGIFVVNNADRLRIDDQWNGRVGAPPAIRDAEYHWVRVRYCSATGQITVFVDGATTPLITATNRTFPAGRVGFGSFDNIGRMRNFTVTGTPGCEGREATITGTDGGEWLAGTDGDDVIATLGGRDNVMGRQGNDTICGGPGDDMLFGQEGDDVLIGEAGRDLLAGGPGRNVLRQED